MGHFAASINTKRRSVTNPWRVYSERRSNSPLWHAFGHELRPPAEDEDEEEQGDESEEEKLNGYVSFGKTFLVPRAKISPYDLGIYPPGLLQARDEVGGLGDKQALANPARRLIQTVCVIELALELIKIIL